MKQQKHRDLIIAWANGEEIETRTEYIDCWVLVECPMWFEGSRYRIKPKEVEKEVLEFIMVSIESGLKERVTDMYWFEENGIHEIIDGIAKGPYESFVVTVVNSQVK